MTNILQHDFCKICYDIDLLFGGVYLMSQFMKNLHEQSEESPDMFTPNVYLGMGFECFIESLIGQFRTDKRITIENYSIVKHNDQGVDGFGYGLGGEIHTVQCKARMNVNGWLTANEDHISNFVAHSKCHYKSQPKHMTVFTTAQGVVTDTCINMYEDEINVINNDGLRSLVDNNQEFWTEFRNEMKISK